MDVTEMECDYVRILVMGNESSDSKTGRELLDELNNL
jgi:hypothetical protein